MYITNINYNDFSIFIEVLYFLCVWDLLDVSSPTSLIKLMACVVI